MYKINQNVAVGNSTKLNLGVIITQTFKDTEPDQPVTTPRVIRKTNGFGIQGPRGQHYLISRTHTHVRSFDWHEPIPIWKDVFPQALLNPDGTWVNITIVYRILIWHESYILVFDNRWDVYD